jgi:hypothetical protein
VTDKKLERLAFYAALVACEVLVVGIVVAMIRGGASITLAAMAAVITGRLVFLARPRRIDKPGSRKR